MLQAVWMEAISRLAVMWLALPCTVFDVTHPVSQHVEVALISPQQGTLPCTSALLTLTRISRLEEFWLWGFSLLTNWQTSIWRVCILVFVYFSLLILIFLENLSQCNSNSCSVICYEYSFGTMFVCPDYSRIFRSWSLKWDSTEKKSCGAPSDLQLNLDIEIHGLVLCTLLPCRVIRKHLSCLCLLHSCGVAKHVCTFHSTPENC